MLTLPRVAIGTMNFGARTPAQEASRIVDRAFERGVTLFDTANFYGEGESERILGTALKGRREQALVATKVGLLRRNGRAEGLSAARIPAALEESLQRLQTDWVDLYYLHAPDHETPIGETLDALQPLLASGRVRHWGVSNYASWQILEIDLECDRRGMPRPVASQVLYNLLVRQLDIEYFRFTRRYPIHTTVYNPLAGGLLARAGADGGTRLTSNPMYRRRYGSEALKELSARYGALAKEAGVDIVQMAYAWVAGRPGVDSVLVGPGSVAHLDAALDGCAASLPQELCARIDELHRAFTGTDASYAR